MIERNTILSKLDDLGIPIEEFEKQFEKAKNERNESFDDVYMASGSFQMIQHQIDILDRKHIPLEFVDTVVVEFMEVEDAKR